MMDWCSPRKIKRLPPKRGPRATSSSQPRVIICSCSTTCGPPRICSQVGICHTYRLGNGCERTVVCLCGRNRSVAVMDTRGKGGSYVYEIVHSGGTKRDVCVGGRIGGGRVQMVKWQGSDSSPPYTLPLERSIALSPSRTHGGRWGQREGHRSNEREGNQQRASPCQTPSRALDIGF